jgi:hypothetical protein
MPSNAYVITPVGGLRRSERRAIAFLQCVGNGDLDAASIFNSLDETRSRELRTRFDHWIDRLVQDRYFHGWPSVTKHKECFVFKWKADRLNNRFYGFLFNPR